MKNFILFFIFMGVTFSVEPVSSLEMFRNESMPTERRVAAAKSCLTEAKTDDQVLEVFSRYLFLERTASVEKIEGHDFRTRFPICALLADKAEATPIFVETFFQSPNGSDRQTVVEWAIQEQKLRGYDSVALISAKMHNATPEMARKASQLIETLNGLIPLTPPPTPEYLKPDSRFIDDAELLELAARGVNPESGASAIKPGSADERPIAQTMRQPRETEQRDLNAAPKRFTSWLIFVLAAVLMVAFWRVAKRR